MPLITFSLPLVQICLLSKNNSSKNKFKSFFKNPVIPSLFLKPIKPKELIELYLRWKTIQAPGYDNISVKVVKRVIPFISNILCKIFNCSMCNGIVPDQMKIGRVTPIHKKGDVSIMNNYRPISVLAIFTIFFERCMYNIGSLHFWTSIIFFTKINSGLGTGTPHLLQ